VDITTCLRRSRQVEVVEMTIEVCDRLKRSPWFRVGGCIVTCKCGCDSICSWSPLAASRVSQQ